jgi:hypothetical protein
MTGLQNIRLINLNGNGGPFILIRASIDCRKATLIEDGSGNGGVGQGIQYYVPDPYSASDVTNQPGVWDTILPQTEPIILGGENSMNAEHGSTLGRGPQDMPGAGVAPSLGTALIWARSATANAIVGRLTESI